MGPQLPPDDQAAVHAYIDGQVPMHSHWRRFTTGQRQLADALDQELVRLMQKVNADDYFGALGISPTVNWSVIRSAADCIRAQFSEERVRAFGLHRKSGDWRFKARRIDALARHALDTLGQMQRDGQLDAHAAICRSALIAAMACPATAPEHPEDHQGESR